MKEYRYPTLLTKNQWLEVLSDSDIISDKRREILLEFGNSPDYRNASSVVGEKYNYSNAGGINLTMMHFASAIAKKHSVELHYFEKKDRTSFWSLFFYGIHDHPYFYWQIRDELAQAMIESKWIDGYTVEYYDEMSIYLEGQKRVSQTVSYERNSAARNKCIEHYGCKCAECGFDFEVHFGEHGKGYIHVHHLRLHAYSGKEHQIDPIEDLRPLCPNCHAMVHRGTKMLSMEELKDIRNH